MNSQNNIKTFFSSIRTAASLLLISTILLGVIYPLAVMLIAKIFFAEEATGSLIVKNNQTIGSHILGQEFTSHKYFWSRPSEMHYNTMDSSGADLSPANPKLIRDVNERVKKLQQADPDNKQKIPVDLVTASASGLDPHISLAAANYQAERIAKARNIEKEEVEQLIKEHTDWQSVLFGVPYVNVLELNLALDKDKN